MKTKNHLTGKRAFTLIEMMMVVAIIGLLAVCVVTNFMLARDTSRLNLISRQVRDIDTARQPRALEKQQPESAPVVDVADLGEYLRSGQVNEVIQESFAPNPVEMPLTATRPAVITLRQPESGVTIPTP